MDHPTSYQLPERNPKTHAQHKREVFWQITVPLLLGILLLLAAVAMIVLSATRATSDVGRWADVSLIWLILPAMFFALVILIILAGFIFLNGYLYKIIPRYARLLQLYFELGMYKITQLTNLVSTPIIKIHTFLAGVRRASGLRPKRYRNSNEL